MGTKINCQMQEAFNIMIYPIEPSFGKAGKSLDDPYDLHLTSISRSGRQINSRDEQRWSRKERYPTITASHQTDS